MKYGILTIIILIILSACTPPTQDTINIGGILILSGVGANWGINAQNGADLAIKEINGQGGILNKQIKITYEDNPADDAKTAVSALQKLHAQNINIILGTTWSGSGQAIAPIVCEKEMLLVSPSLGVADVNEECDTNFNLWPHDADLSKYLGEHVANNVGKNIALIGHNAPWSATQSKMAKKGVEEAYGNLVVFEEVPLSDKDYLDEATKIKNADPNAIILTNYEYQHLGVKKIKELGINAPIYSVLLDQERIDAADGAFENTKVITSFTPSKEFVKKFEKEYGETPDIGSDTAYDAIYLLAQAIEKTKSTDPKDISIYLNSLKEYTGESGHLIFDGKGGVKKDPKFMIVKDNQLIDYKD